MSVVIVDYGSGNLRSAEKAFERAVREAGLSMDVAVTGDPDRVRAADRVVLPGVGAFADCRAGLMAVDGMVEAITEHALGRAKPFLGICVGMQLMTSRSAEYGDTPGLDWIKGAVADVTPADPTLKVPHMGWNELEIDRPDHPVLAGLERGAHAYFVHSFHVRTEDPARVLAHVDYGGPITAVIGRDTLVGTQFHPEKSQATGLRLITNFLTWSP